MLGAAYRVARVWGIPIRIHISLVVLLALVAGSGGVVGFLTGGLAGALEGTAQLLGFALGVFASIVLHELGHSVVAIAKGCRVREITLMFLGGAAQMERIPEKPLDEFLMAIAGPAVSVALGFALWLGGAFLPLQVDRWPVPFLRIPPIDCNIVQYLGIVNFGLAAFNLLPAFPMDGGRILRALLVRRKGRLQATRIASRLGKLAAILFGIRGVMDFFSGWILVFMALFLYSAAEREYQSELMRHRARQRPFGWPGGWEPPGDPPDDPEDRVVISPPPYERGPDREAEIRRDRDDLL